MRAFSGVFQRLCHGQDIGRLVRAQEGDDMAEDAPVLVTIEIRVGNLAGNTIPDRVIQQEAAQHRLLGFNGMRRQAQLRYRRVGGGRGRGLAEGRGFGHGLFPARGGEFTLLFAFASRGADSSGGAISSSRRAIGAGTPAFSASSIKRHSSVASSATGICATR